MVYRGAADYPAELDVTFEDHESENTEARRRLAKRKSRKVKSKGSYGASGGGWRRRLEVEGCQANADHFGSIRASEREDTTLGVALTVPECDVQGHGEDVQITVNLAVELTMTDNLLEAETSNQRRQLNVFGTRRIEAVASFNTTSDGADFWGSAGRRRR